jgi:hypothetical protein
MRMELLTWIMIIVKDAESALKSVPSNASRWCELMSERGGLVRNEN